MEHELPASQRGDRRGGRDLALSAVKAIRERAGPPRLPPASPTDCAQGHACFRPGRAGPGRIMAAWIPASHGLPGAQRPGRPPRGGVEPQATGNVTVAPSPPPPPLWEGPRPGSCGGAMFRRLVFSIETQADAAPLASHWRFKLNSCFRSVQASKPAWLWDSGKYSRTLRNSSSCARFMGMRTLGRFESQEIAAKGCFGRGSRRPTPPRNRSGGSPFRPSARADAR